MRANEREIMEYLREARDWMQELRNPKAPAFEPFVPFEGVEFVKPGTANEEPAAQEPTRDVKWKVVCDGWGTWRALEAKSELPIALSLTEENARQIVSDHNREVRL